MIPFQNISPGAPNSLLQVAVKNNQQPVWYFNDKIPLHVFFGEDGKMERAGFLEVKSAIMFVWFSCFFFSCLGSEYLACNHVFFAHSTS